MTTAHTWHLTETGGGRVIQRPEALALCLPPTPAHRYGNAQISSYRARADFRLRPPLRLTVTAWASAGATALCGTAGFGLWNHPFAPGERGFRLPRAAWFFFSSPPSDMRLALDVPGPGWKAATIDAQRRAFFALLPAAPVGLLLMRLPALYRRLWPVGQRAIGVSEALLPPHWLAERHTYHLDWQPNGLTFAVDGDIIHQSASAPGAPLGFIAWMDNQYAVVTPQGRFGFGLVAVEAEQALMLEQITLE